MDKDSLFHIFRLVVFLYEDLRNKLIRIIDENLNIDEILTQDYIDLIYKQQDIIDEYLKIFDLKKQMNLEIDTKNINKFLMNKDNDDFLKKNFDLDKNVVKKSKRHLTTKQREEFLQVLKKMKMERQILESRIQDLKELM